MARRGPSFRSHWLPISAAGLRRLGSGGLDGIPERQNRCAGLLSRRPRHFQLFMDRRREYGQNEHGHDVRSDVYRYRLGHLLARSHTFQLCCLAAFMTLS